MKNLGDLAEPCSVMNNLNEHLVRFSSTYFNTPFPKTQIKRFLINKIISNLLVVLINSIFEDEQPLVFLSLELMA